MIHPLKPHQHGSGLINIASGKLSRDSDINADNSLEIGTKQMESFSEGLPTTFGGGIKKNVVFMRSENKCAKVGDIPVYATEALYARIMCLMSMGRIQHIDDVLKYELAPIPTALFMEMGDINHATSKSGLKHKLNVEVSGRHIHC